MEKRRQYDQIGEERRAARDDPARTNDTQFEADISPEDLFNMFFGGGFPTSESERVFVRPKGVLGDESRHGPKLTVNAVLRTFTGFKTVFSFKSSP